MRNKNKPVIRDLYFCLNKQEHPSPQQFIRNIAKLTSDDNMGGVE